MAIENQLSQELHTQYLGHVLTSLEEMMSCMDDGRRNTYRPFHVYRLAFCHWAASHVWGPDNEKYLGRWQDLING
jgi:hypothetical protein